MPIPLGILAAAGFRPTAGGSYELIETITVGAGGAASVTFSNLNTYSSTYQHLQIRYTARADNAFPDNNMAFRINGSTNSADYRAHLIDAYGSGTPTSGTATGNRIFGSAMNGNTNVSGSFAAGVIDFLDPYETTKNKTIRHLSGYVGGNHVLRVGSGLYMSTSAISSITLLSWTDNGIIQGSRFSIYGLKN